jgi:cold shock CspA family protein
MPDDYRKDITGKIIYLNDEGWGYINTHAIKFSKVYFHWTGLETSTKNFLELKAGDTLKFNAIKREKGWKAINIVVETENGQEKVG